MDKTMVIAILKLILFINNSNSLKTKRMVLQSLKTRLRNRFNIAISEVGDEDKWQKSTLAIVGVQKEKRFMDRQFSQIINFIENFNQASIVDYEMELI
ncbi:MAG: DUF503 domain-containing protein [Candidatus Omnitrophota bacterium]